MASGRQIVSTPVPDVVSNFASVVKIGKDINFVQMCLEAVGQPDETAVARGLEMAAANIWEDIVARMEGHISAALEQRQLVRATASRALLMAELPLESEAA